MIREFEENVWFGLVWFCAALYHHFLPLKKKDAAYDYLT